MWFVSDEGSDQNSCVERSWPCKTLQTVLNRCPDDSVIYVISPGLILNEDQSCQVKYEKSFRIADTFNTILVKCSKGNKLFHSASFNGIQKQEKVSYKISHVTYCFCRLFCYSLDTIR